MPPIPQRISKKWLRDQKSCKEGYRAFLEQFTIKGQDDTGTFDLLYLARDKRNFDFYNWLFLRVSPLDIYLEYTRFAAHLAYQFRDRDLDAFSQDIMQYGTLILTARLFQEMALSHGE